MGLRLKFIVLISLLILVTSLALSYFFLDHLESEEALNLETLGLTVARNLAYNAELGVLTRNRVMLLDLCQGPLQQQDVAYIRVLDRDGEQLAGLDASPDTRPAPRPPEDLQPSGDRSGQVLPVKIAVGGGPAVDGLEVRVPVFSGGRDFQGEEIGFLLEESEADRGRREMIGTMVVGLSLEHSQIESARLRRAFGFLTALVVAFGVVMTVLIVHAVIKPINRLVLATRRVAEGKLDQRVPAGSRDELGDLGRSFNRMAENLAVSREALESYSADLEEKVRQRTGELETAQTQLIQAEKMSAMGELVSGVAHELNNPLAGVIGYSQLLLGSGIEEKTRRGLERINREADRCKRIVQNLQVFARKHKPQKNYVGINGALAATLDLRTYQLQVDNISVETDFQSDLPKTMADFHQLQQVFMNLLVNAHHAIKSAGRAGKLIVRTERSGDRILIHISDNGCGISADCLKKIFDPFFTTKEVGQGTGLGLSICYGIIQEHRGLIRAESTPGEGTRFTVELPVLEPPPGEAAESQSTAQNVPTKVRASLRKSNILVIDDESSITDVLYQALKMDGHRVDTAANGLTALNKIRAERYDVIISDMKMPGMDGRALYEAVREMSPDLAQRMIFSTGDVASQDTRSFLQRSGNPYLQKPFDLDSIRSVVARMLMEVPN